MPKKTTRPLTKQVYLRSNRPSYHEFERRVEIMIMNSNIGKTQLTNINQVRGARLRPNDKYKSWDCHCWLEVTLVDGRIDIWDYDDKKLIKDINMPKNAQLIRQPFNIELQKQVHKEAYKNYKIAIKEMKELGEKTEKYRKGVWLNETGNCMCRAYMLKELCDQDAAKECGIKQIRIVFGSLGWENDAGIMWEYG